MEDGVKRRSFLVANCAPAAIVESSLPSELRSYRFFFNIIYKVKNSVAFTSTSLKFLGFDKGFEQIA